MVKNQLLQHLLLGAKYIWETSESENFHHENLSYVYLKQLTSKIVAVSWVDPWDSGCMAGSGSIVIQCQSNAMPSGIDVNWMPKTIMEIGAWERKKEKRHKGWKNVKKEAQETTTFFKSLLPTCDHKQAAEPNMGKNSSWKELIASESKLA